MHRLTLLESSFLRILKQKLTAALNNYAVMQATDTVDGASALGVSNQLFARSVGSQMDADFGSNANRKSSNMQPPN